MCGKKKYYLILLLLGLTLQLHAQKEKYTEITGGYDVQILKNKGGNIHIWSGSKRSSFFYTVNTILTLSIFSPEMKFIAEKEVKLGNVNSWSLHLNYIDNCYYAMVFYASERNNHLLLKVDPNGNIINLNHSAIPPSTDPIFFSQPSKSTATIRTNNNLFAVQTEQPDFVVNINPNNTIFLNAENYSASKIFKTISIRKVNLKTGKGLEQIYASSFINFYYPLIMANDSGIFTCSFAKSASENNLKNPYRGSFIFLSKLDTNLNEAGLNSSVLLQNAKNVRSQEYRPVSMFTTGDKLQIILLGQDFHQSRPAQPVFDNEIPFFNLLTPAQSLPVSLRLIIIDANNNFSKDTVIENRSGNGNINWDEHYIVHSDKKTDLFFTRHYHGSKNGIVHISVASNGDLTEEDMVVDLRYKYNLFKAVSPDWGILLIPYSKGNKTMGILRLLYDESEALQ